MKGVDVITAEPIEFPGGRIDAGRLDQGEIYLGEPMPAVAPPGCEVAEKYAAYISAGEFDKVAALYTPDATIFHDGGAPVTGEAAIREFYGRRIKGLGVKLVPVSYAVGPGMCLVQLAVARALEDGKLEYFSASFDQFFLAPDGRARMMVVYGRKTPIVQGVIKDLIES